MQHGSGPFQQMALPGIDDCIKLRVIRIILSQKLTCKIRLKRSKPEDFIWVSFDNKLNGMVAQIANTVKKDDIIVLFLIHGLIMSSVLPDDQLKNSFQNPQNSILTHTNTKYFRWFSFCILNFSNPERADYLNDLTN